VPLSLAKLRAQWVQLKRRCLEADRRLQDLDRQYAVALSVALRADERLQACEDDIYRAYPDATLPKGPGKGLPKLQ